MTPADVTRCFHDHGWILPTCRCGQRHPTAMLHGGTAARQPRSGSQADVLRAITFCSVGGTMKKYPATGAVPSDRSRPGPRPTGASAMDSNVIEDLDEHRAVVALTAGQHDRQRHAIAVNHSMDLAAQPAT